MYKINIIYYHLEFYVKILLIRNSKINYLEFHYLSYNLQYLIYLKYTIIDIVIVI